MSKNTSRVLMALLALSLPITMTTANAMPGFLQHMDHVAMANKPLHPAESPLEIAAVGVNGGDPDRPIILNSNANPNADGGAVNRVGGSQSDNGGDHLSRVGNQNNGGNPLKSDPSLLGKIGDPINGGDGDPVNRVGDPNNGGGSPSNGDGGPLNRVGNKNNGPGIQVNGVGSRGAGAAGAGITDGTSPGSGGGSGNDNGQSDDGIIIPHSTLNLGNSSQHGPQPAKGANIQDPDQSSDDNDQQKHFKKGAQGGQTQTTDSHHKDVNVGQKTFHPTNFQLNPNTPGSQAHDGDPPGGHKDLGAGSGIYGFPASDGGGKDPAKLTLPGIQGYGLKPMGGGGVQTGGGGGAGRPNPAVTLPTTSHDMYVKIDAKNANATGPGGGPHTTNGPPGGTLKKSDGGSSSLHIPSAATRGAFMKY